MSATSETTPTIDPTTDLDPTAAAVWFEACVEHRGPSVDGPCEQCGWLGAEHTAGLAVVIAVPHPAPAPRLRRAS